VLLCAAANIEKKCAYEVENRDANELIDLAAHIKQCALTGWCCSYMLPSSSSSLFYLVWYGG